MKHDVLNRIGNAALATTTATAGGGSLELWITGNYNYIMMGMAALSLIATVTFKYLTYRLEHTKLKIYKAKNGHD